jgi:crotonobetainyl-CoA:carnitine CoA-transferase CaiB-like acyl-CoA transferase
MVCAATEALVTSRGGRGQVTTSPELIVASFAAPEHLRIDGRTADGWGPMSGFFEASDGWVRLHGNYPHHAAAIRAALHAETRRDLVSAARTISGQEIEDAVIAAGGVATKVRTVRQWDLHPHATATAADPWWDVEPTGERSALSPNAVPLAGVRVLDFTRVLAGPACSQLLACLGADVLRIDPPGTPELLDQYLLGGMGKRSASADLSLDLEPVRTQLLPEADVVLLGYRPGSLDRFGLNPQSLAAGHPQMVVASLSAWGDHGPWGARPGFDSIVQAATGIADICAGPDGSPGALPVQALDYATGYALAAGVIGLLGQARGGLVKANLLGASRILLSERRRGVSDPVSLEVPTVSVDSPHGRLVTVPPPVMLDGETLSRAVGGYAAEPLAWQARS